MSSSPSVADTESSGASLRLALKPSLHSLEVRRTLVGFGIPVFVFILPLLVWPGQATPFSSPKLLAWVAATALFGMVHLTAWRERAVEISTKAVIRFSLLVMCIGVSAGLGATADIESLLLVLTALAWFALLGSAKVETHHVSIALVGAASVMAVISLFQFAGADPFHLAGWYGVGGTSARMRVYATLGNPNFVGAFLAGVLPLTIAMGLDGRHRQRIFAIAAMLQGVGILASGSRAAALGALVGCGLVFTRNANPRRWLGLALCLSVALPVLGLTQARALPETVQGRLYVWRVALPQVSSIPVFGFGPGAFEEQFDRWQQKYFHAGNSPDDQRFAGRFDHAHNDFLEWTVEYGWAGIGALAGCLGMLLAYTWRRGRASPISRAALAGACGLGLITLVDFPFHRPEGLFLVATFLAVACTGSGKQPSTTKEQAVPR